MKVQDVMTHDVLCVAPEASLKKEKITSTTPTPANVLE